LTVFHGDTYQVNRCTLTGDIVQPTDTSLHSLWNWIISFKGYFSCVLLGFTYRLGRIIITRQVGLGVGLIFVRTIITKYQVTLFIFSLAPTTTCVPMWHKTIYLAFYATCIAFYYFNLLCLNRNIVRNSLWSIKEHWIYVTENTCTWEMYDCL